MPGSLQGRSTGVWPGFPWQLLVACCPPSAWSSCSTPYTAGVELKEKSRATILDAGTDLSQLLLTWKKAALVRGTRMSWEPPVGMGARDEGRIWGQS